MTNFVKIENASFQKLRLKPSAVYTKGSTCQGNAWITGGYGAWIIRRGSIVNPAPLNGAATEKVVANGLAAYDAPCERVVNNLMSECFAATYIQDDEILESDMPAGTKGRDNTRLVILESARGQRVQVNADILKALIKCLAPNGVYFFQAEGKPTSPVTIQTQYGERGIAAIIMPVAKLETKKAKAEHKRVMRAIQA